MINLKTIKDYFINVFIPARKAKMLGDNIKSYYGIHKLNTTNGETTYSAWGYKPMDTPKYILDLAEITVELDKQDKYVQERKKMNQDVREQCAKELETAVDKLKEML